MTVIQALILFGVAVAAALAAAAIYLRTDRLIVERVSVAFGILFGVAAYGFAMAAVFIDDAENTTTRASLIERIEAKYDIRIVESLLNDTEEPSTWIVDDRKTECYVEDGPEGDDADDYDAITDPVLRCDEPEPLLPEYSKD